MNFLKKMNKKRNEKKLLDKYFDSEYYASNYLNSGTSGKDALQHFLDIGWKIGNDPAKWFSLKDYVALYPDVKEAGLNPFVHYLTKGMDEGRMVSKMANKILNNSDEESSVNEVDLEALIEKLPKKLQEDITLVQESAYWDAKYYARINEDLKDSGLNPLLHFCQFGWREGRNPSAVFDIKYYKANSPIKNQENKNPLVEFMEFGLEGDFVPNEFGYLPMERPIAPSEDEWHAIQKSRSIEDENTIDVIIPVYRGFDETLRCIYAVFAAKSDVPYNLIVIDDCSPEPELSEKLHELSEKGLFTLLVNEENLGFVKTVNRGMMLHKHDVVLLNSDTHVYDYWIDRLLDHAERLPNVATVTPFSNNATICSYPHTLLNNSYEIELSGSELNDLMYESNKATSVDVPTGVGFCFYISRKALDEVGYFDEEAFAKGYGEENDFCVRSKLQGYRNLFALDIYVKHYGEVSFANDAKEMQDSGLKALIKKHPDYLSHVHHYIQEDPAKISRLKVDIARVKRNFSKVCVFVSHSWGGGIEKNIQDMTALLEAQDIGVIILRINGSATENVFFDVLNDGFSIANRVLLHAAADRDEIVELLTVIDPALVHIHSLFTLRESLRKSIIDLLISTKYPVFYTAHDFSFKCPHAQFVPDDFTYCGEPEIGGCHSCLKKNPPMNGWVDITDYHDTYKRLLDHCQGIYAPSANTKSKVDAFLGNDKTEVREHFEEYQNYQKTRIRRSKSKRVAFIGAIGSHKGKHFIDSLTTYADFAKKAINFQLIGYIGGTKISANNFVETGEYKSEEECVEHLRRYNPDYIFFPSIWPETYNYTLSIAFKMNIPPIVFDIGAPAERVRKANFGHVLPVEWMHSPEKVVNFLMASETARLSMLEHRALLRDLANQSSHDLMHDYYGIERS
ncbi:glycosyltransferase [Temperatibacter marinus]|uniref:Glycosyltransferase n=1 Tax=Temperatibacter marinus TaxID=1456591 RepID=A0AA52EIJ9_9PROT|nr:glycosyltransferase [Temperatibacter marinus]WND03192.1 glycosyltransferase [Temperatibacter marinus]